jgi:hypothetical protein
MPSMYAACMILLIKKEIHSPICALFYHSFDLISIIVVVTLKLPLLLLSWFYFSLCKCFFFFLQSLYDCSFMNIMISLCLLFDLYFLFLYFYVKTTFEDVFPAEATSVEEYLQQVIFFLQKFSLRI